jgi:hypothetical protein
MKRSWLVLLFALVATTVLSAQPIKAGANPPSGAAPIILDHIIDPNTVLFSKTFSEWDAEWQQWAFSIPEAKHPLFDHGDCSTGQTGPVWFLGGKFCAVNEGACSYTGVQRNCAVPRGKYIYVPVWNAEDSALEEKMSEHPGDESYQQITGLRSLYDPFTQTVATGHASIDGVAVPHLEKYLVQSTVFAFTVPEGNYLQAIYTNPPADFPAGTYYPAVDSGDYLMIAPLPPGNHVIKFDAYYPAWDFKLDITYFLTVQK